MNIFEEIKNRLDMRTVAENYGIDIKRNNTCCCPFHNDRHPSAYIYPNAFHCFGCGEHADIIGFTQKYFSLDSPAEAVKKLDSDFNLYLESDKPVSKHEISEHQKRIAEQKKYEIWEKNSWITLNKWFHMCRDFKKLCRPKNPYLQPDERWVYASHNMELAEEISSEYLQCEYSERRKFEKWVRYAQEGLNTYLHYDSGLPKNNGKIRRTDFEDELRKEKLNGRKNKPA